MNIALERQELANKKMFLLILLDSWIGFVREKKEKVR